MTKTRLCVPFQCHFLLCCDVNKHMFNIKLLFCHTCGIFGSRTAAADLGSGKHFAGPSCSRFYGPSIAGVQHVSSQAMRGGLQSRQVMRRMLC